METIFMISGLGAGQDSILELDKALNQHGYSIKYLDLPGQYSNYNVMIKNERDLSLWFQSNIPSHSIVMAYSLGADLFLKFIKKIQPSKTIILDGGILDTDFTKTNLEAEKDFSVQYIKNNKLHMMTETISQLFDIKYNKYRDVFSLDEEEKILLLLSDTPIEAYQYKKNKVESYRQRGKTGVETLFIKDTSHEFYTEKPDEICKAIVKYLS